MALPNCLPIGIFLYLIRYSQADALVAGGFVEAGYSTIHLDDCIVDKMGRDPTTHELRADPERYVHLLKVLGQSSL